MAKILTTKGCAASLEHIIRKCEKELYILSFSYIISDPFIMRLRQASERGINIHIVYGKSIKPETLEKLKTIKHLNIYYYADLHAKIFANETQCMIGSMNFSEASEINNTELGVLLTAKSDPASFDEAMEHCKDILHGATPMTQSQINSNPNTKPKTVSSYSRPLKEEAKDRSYKANYTTQVKFEYKSDMDYHTPDNFIYPSLFELIKLTYPKLEVEIDEEFLQIADFTNHINLELTGRLDFNFDDENYYEKFKHKYQSLVSKELNFFRVYWNHCRINVYLPKGYEFDINQKELKHQVDKFFLAIKTIKELAENLI